MSKDLHNLSRVVAGSGIKINDDFSLDRDMKKRQIRKILEEDPDLFDEVIMEIRKEKIQKIRNK